MRLSGDAREIREAYENAFKLARAKRDPGDLANTARSFAGYIRDYGPSEGLGEALDRLNEAIFEIADDASLHISRGTLLVKLGEISEARASYEMAVKIGNTREQAAGAASLRRLEILSSMNFDVPSRGDGLVNSHGPALGESFR